MSPIAITTNPSPQTRGTSPVTPAGSTESCQMSPSLIARDGSRSSSPQSDDVDPPRPDSQQQEISDHSQQLSPPHTQNNGTPRWRSDGSVYSDEECFIYNVNSDGSGSGASGDERHCNLMNGPAGRRNNESGDNNVELVAAVYGESDQEEETAVRSALKHHNYSVCRYDGTYRNTNGVDNTKEAVCNGDKVGKDSDVDRNGMCNGSNPDKGRNTSSRNITNNSLPSEGTSIRYSTKTAKKSNNGTSFLLHGKSPKKEPSNNLRIQQKPNISNTPEIGLTLDDENGYVSDNDKRPSYSASSDKQSDLRNKPGLNRPLRTETLRHSISDDVDNSTQIKKRTASPMTAVVRTHVGAVCNGDPPPPSPSTPKPRVKHSGDEERGDATRRPGYTTKTDEGGDSVHTPISPAKPRDEGGDAVLGSRSPASKDGEKGSPQGPGSSTKRALHPHDPLHVSHQFFVKEPCLYSHRMFVRAARIFAVLKHDDADTDEKKARRRRDGNPGSNQKQKIPEMEFLDAHEQIKTFELTFATLKFQKLFSHILDHVGFFYKYPGMNDHYALVYVILYDIQSRKFQRREPFPKEELDNRCLDIENVILSEKVKLQSNFAKERIRHNAMSVAHLLPEHVRNKDETKARTPVYMWVNQFKTTADHVIGLLTSDGFTQLDDGTEVSDVTDRAFLVDPHCYDLMTFPPHLALELSASDVVREGLLVQQDKSSCLAPQTVSQLLSNESDAIHVNIGTGTTTCHLASLLRHRSPNSHIWAFGSDGGTKASKMTKTMELLEVKNIRVMPDDFLSSDPEDSKFRPVRIILITADCSKSAITSPVQFIVSEGEDTQILGDLSAGEADMRHVSDLASQHERLLRHALKFPKVQAVVYATRSRFEVENENVINRVLDTPETNHNKRPTFKVAPPVLPFSGDEIDSSKGGVDGRYIRFRPSDKANGSFVAIIAREPEESKDHRGPGGKAKYRNSHGKSRYVTPNLAAAESSGGSRNRSRNRKSASRRADGSSPRKEASLTDTALDTDGEAACLSDSLSAATASPDARRHQQSPSSTASIKRQVSMHKSPVAAGARLYQKSLISKMDRARQEIKPEHVRVIKHPAPFRGSK